MVAEATDPTGPVSPCEMMMFTMYVRSMVMTFVQIMVPHEAAWKVVLFPASRVLSLKVYRCIVFMMPLDVLMILREIIELVLAGVSDIFPECEVVVVPEVLLVVLRLVLWDYALLQMTILLVLTIRMLILSDTDEDRTASLMLLLD